MVVEHVETLIMNNHQVHAAQDDQIHGLQRGDHHLVDGAGDEDQEHAVGEILKHDIDDEN